MCDGRARIYIAIDRESAGDLLRVLTFEGTVNAFFYIYNRSTLDICVLDYIGIL
jgi:hypothetical protein